MATPKKITVSSVDTETGEKTMDWVFTMDGDKVVADKKRDDPFYPKVFDKDADGGNGGYLKPDDGRLFMERLKDAYPRASYVNIEVED